MNSEDLSDYISDFPEKQKDTVFKEVISSRLLKQVFETKEGSLVLNDAISLITDRVTEILAVGCSRKYDDGEKSGKILSLANEINVTKELMRRWAGILNIGEAHEKRMKPKNKEG